MHLSVRADAVLIETKPLENKDTDCGREKAELEKRSEGRDLPALVERKPTRKRRVEPDGISQPNRGRKNQRIGKRKY
jgi:hypothetical protein